MSSSKWGQGQFAAQWDETRQALRSLVEREGTVTSVFGKAEE